MDRYFCVMEDDKICDRCGECEMCDLNPEKVCDNCGKCKTACPGNAISDNGEVDPWQCAVYYNGANGTKNPFMPYDAFADFENRLEIIAGEAKVTPETARKILDKMFENKKLSILIPILISVTLYFIMSAEVTLVAALLKSVKNAPA